MKKVMTLVLAIVTCVAVNAQSREETRRVILGGNNSAPTDVILGGSNNQPVYSNEGRVKHPHKRNGHHDNGKHKGWYKQKNKNWKKGKR